MPEIQYPKNPNSDTAFVVQEDGTKNRALMTAPQDTSTLELPSNANSTKGYVTIDGKKQRVILTADIGGGGGSSLPDQDGHSGEFLTTDGTDASWAAVDALPDQTGQSGKFLTTDGTDASWSDKPLVNTATGNDSIVLGTTNNTGTVRSVIIGSGSSATVFADDVVAIGRNAEASTAGVAIGASAKATLPYTIQIGYDGTNSDAKTFKVANGNGNFEIMSADGTVPTARLTKVNTTATLAVADWSSNTQTVSVTGMTANGVVLVSPTPANQSAYTSAGILCTSQAAGSLTFTCDTVPSADITVTVVML